MSKDDFDPNGWMVTFADLVMLLLTFFVLLLTMSSMDTKKLQNIFTHFREATGVLNFSGAKEISDLADFISSYNDSSSLLVIDQNKFLDSISLPESLSKLQRNHSLQADMTDDARGIVLHINGENLFDSGKIEIKAEAFPVLDAIADAIQGCPNDITIMGHTDDIPVESDLYKSNWELSLYRGLSVLEYFLKEKKLQALRFAVGGYGSARPLYPNDTPEGRASNRRIEIIFKHLEGA
jgi:chemotaxis protein MotB